MTQASRWFQIPFRTMDSAVCCWANISNSRSESFRFRSIDKLWSVYDSCMVSVVCCWTTLTELDSFESIIWSFVKEPFRSGRLANDCDRLVNPEFVWAIFSNTILTPGLNVRVIGAQKSICRSECCSWSLQIDWIGSVSQLTGWSFRLLFRVWRHNVMSV